MHLQSPSRPWRNWVPEDLAQLREAEPFSRHSTSPKNRRILDLQPLGSNGSKGRSTRRSPLLSTLRATARMNGRSNLEPETRRQFRHSCQRLKKLRATILPASGLYTRATVLVAWLTSIQLSAGCHGGDLRKSANPVRARLRPREWHLRSSQILVSAVLSVGFDLKACRALIADVEELAGEGFGLEMVYWVLEIIEDFMRASTPAAEAREIFLHGALSRMAPIYARLSSLQRTAVAHLACELGWTLR